MYKHDGVLVLHYYKSIVDGVMTSLIDTFFNIRKEADVRMRIICPELYSLDHDDYYDFDIDDTQWYEYKNDIGLDVEKYKGNDEGFDFHFKANKNKITTAIPFLRYNRNLGDFNLFYSIDQENNTFKADTVICSGRLIYEILNGANIYIECNRLIVLDSLDTYKSKIGVFPNFDLLFDTMFRNSDIIQLSNPATMRDSKYEQREYYHKFSLRRLDALKQSGIIKDKYEFDRRKKPKILITDSKHFENVGKGIFEHLWFRKKVYYKPNGMMHDKDGLYYYLKLFGIDATKEQELPVITKDQIRDKLFWRKNEIQL
jgi:hypothetical protein